MTKSSRTMQKSTMILIICALLIVVVMATTTFAWLSANANFINASISGSLVTEYFHCGNGSEDDPFVITRPIHYYHMVEFFQRLTNLGVVYYEDEQGTAVTVKFGEEYLYFQIGCSEERLYDPSLPHTSDSQGDCYVFSYTNTGEQVLDSTGKGEKCQNLNMAYYGGERALMPIGTSIIPFNGQLDGKGITVSNLNIVTTSTVVVKKYDNDGSVISSTEKERSTCDVGVFGFVAANGKPHGSSEIVDSCIKDVYFDGLTIDLSNLDYDAITSEVDGESHTVNTAVHGNNTCYAGYIAGHISTSANINDVYVNNATIIGGAAAEIGFGYFGCVEDADTQQTVQALGTTISTLFSAGNDPGWGGSVDMKTLFSRLFQIADTKSSQNNYYPTSITEVVNKETGEIVRYVTASNNRVSSTQNTGNYRLSFRSYSSTLGGSYYFNNANGHNPYIYLSGVNGSQTAILTTYEMTDDNNGIAYYFSDERKVNYLGISSSLEVANANANTAVKWNQDNDGHLFAYIGMTAYYLNSEGTTLQLSTDAINTWTVTTEDGTTTIKTTVSETDYYLNFSEVWNLSTQADTYSICDNSGHYLSANSTSVINSTSAAGSAEWNHSTRGGLHYFSTVINGTTYYLAFNEGLCMQTQVFGWSREDATGDFYSYYYETDEIKWYLGYEDGWTVVCRSGRTITYNDNGTTRYLTANQSRDGVVSYNEEKFASLWQVSSENDISILIDGKRYYLNCDATSGDLTLSTSPYTWTIQNDSHGDIIYTVKNSVPYYMTYSSSGWKVEYSDRQAIASNGYYLGIAFGDEDIFINAVATSEGVSENEAWTIDTLNGYIYITVRGRNYYLAYKTGTDAGLYLSDETFVWSKDELGWYTTVSSTNYYLSLESLNGTYYWDAVAVYNTLLFNEQYLALNNTKDGITTSATITDYTKWQFDYNNNGTGKVWCVIDGVRYYLSHDDNANLIISSTPFAWTITDNSLSYVGTKCTYYVSLVNNRCILTPESYYLLSSVDNSTTYFLKLNTDGTVSKVTDCASQGCFIQLSNAGGDTYISSYINETEYYLYYSHNYYGTLGTTAENPGTNSSTVDGYWHYDNGQYYVSSTGVKYYLQSSDSNYIAWENQWMEITATTSNPSSTHYLGYNYTTNEWQDYTAVPSTRNTHLRFDDSNYLCFEIPLENGSNFVYLNVDTDNIELVTEKQTTAHTVWQTDNSGVSYYTVIDGRKYYLTFDDTNLEWTLILAGWYRISNGTNHLTIENSTIGNSSTSSSNPTDVDAGAKWQMTVSPESTNTTTSTNIYRIVGTDRYYLGCTTSGSLTFTQTTTPQNWYKDSVGYYVVDSTTNTKYHLVYDNGWKVKVVTYYTISSINESNSTLYLTWNGSTGIVTDGNSSVTDNAKWQISNFTDTNGSTTTISVAYNGGYKYLGVDNGSLVVGDTPYTWTREVDTDNKYYYKCGNYYLAYDYGWRAMTYTSWSYLKSGTHYLAFNGSDNVVNDLTSISSRNENARFIISNGTIRNIGRNKYVNASNNNVTLSNGSVTWIISEDSYSLNNSTLTYDTTYMNGWSCFNTAGLKSITCGSTTLGTDGNKLTAGVGSTKWYYSNDHIWTYYHGTEYYINFNNSDSKKLSVSTTASNNWSDGTGSYPNSYYYIYDSQTYYITYDSDGWVYGTDSSNKVIGWIATPLLYLVGANSGEHYMSIKNGTEGYGTTAFADRTNKYAATQWDFSVSTSASPSGQMSAVYNGSKYYVGENVGAESREDSLKLSKTSSDAQQMTNNNNNLQWKYGNQQCGGQTAHIQYTNRGGWQTDSGTYQLKFYPTVLGLTITTSPEQTSITEDSKKIEKQSSTYNSSNTDINIVPGADGLNVDYGIGSFSNTLSYALQSFTEWIESQTNISDVTNQPATYSPAYMLLSSLKTLSSPIETILLRTKYFFVTQTSTKAQTFENKGTKTINSGVSTWFPLALALSDEDDPTSWDSSDYKVHPTRNTGYIVSGANSTDSSSAYRSDIRVSNYSTSDIYRAINSSNRNAVTFNGTYNGRLEILTRTVNSDGWKRIEDSYNQGNTSVNNALSGYSKMSVSDLGLDKYEYMVNDPDTSVQSLGGARTGLYNMLDGGSNVYGLHFMDAAISKSNIVVADQVTIYSNTYTNYQLPEDCIDCNIISRGSISFFAGTYYSGNSSFFSLHHIFRNSRNAITDIKEIVKIYQHSTAGAAKKNIYLYSDGTWSDGAIRSTSAIPDNYELAFDMNWSKSPEIVQNAVYYLEIPVNAGEYALGCVSGKTGAYLLYLDIATNGGGEEEVKISNEGNTISEKFKVEYRDQPDVVAHSLLQFSITAPTVASSDKFSVNVEFTKGQAIGGNNDSPSDYSLGLYTITIVNMTGSKLDLAVFLCDDDTIADNDYLYAYRLIVNGTTVMSDSGSPFIKVCAEYDIPSA